MRNRTYLLGGLLLVGVFLVGGANLLQGQQAGIKTIKLKLLLPQPNTVVTVDGKAVPGEGERRTLTMTVAKDKKFVQLTAFWEPNNYTKITRPRKVEAKDGEVTVDFLKPSDTEKDDIVVRYVPTPPDVVDAMCQVAKVGKNDVVYDLGCGDGIMVITAVKKFGAKRGVGIDLDSGLGRQVQGGGQSGRRLGQGGVSRWRRAEGRGHVGRLGGVALHGRRHQRPFEADPPENPQAGQPGRFPPFFDGGRLEARPDRHDSKYGGIPLFGTSLGDQEEVKGKIPLNFRSWLGHHKSSMKAKDNSCDSKP